MKRLVQLIFLLLVSLAGTPDGNAQFFAGQQQALVNQGFDPADYGTPSLVIIPEQDPLLDPGNAASAATDLSANGYDFAQGTGSSQPLWAAGATPGGKAALTFDGTDDWMTAGDVLDLGSANVTVMVVFDRNSGKPGLLCKSLAGAANGRWAFTYDGGSTDLSGLVAEPGAVRVAAAAETSTDWQLITMVYVKGSPGSLTLYRNGTLFATSAFTTVAGALNTTYALLLGAYNNNTDGLTPLAGSYLSGSIAAAVVWLETLADREGMEDAAGEYFGITITH